MKTIRITYKDYTIDPSICIILFFRMIGIYISEKFFEPKVDLQNEIALLWEDYPDVTAAANDFRYDSEFFLITDLSDYLSYKRINRNADRTILILADENIHSLNSQEPDAISYITKDEKGLLTAIINQLSDKGMITLEEREDCLFALDFFINQNYKSLTLSGKYFFDSKEHQQEKTWYDLQYARYENICMNFFERIQPLQLTHWGENRYMHTQFAFVNTVYEANLFCKRNNQSFIFHTKSMLDVAKQLQEHLGGYLGSSIKLLIGQIYNDLLDNENTAYEYFLSCCDNFENKYNSYVFFLKGQYWQNFVGDYHTSNQYYLKSILIYPEYYRAWYKLGYCYFKNKQKDKALIAFNTVQKILSHRLEQQVIRPLELEHLFLACSQCAGLTYELSGNSLRSIEYDLYAERTWKGIQTSRFFDQLYGVYKNELHVLYTITEKQLNIASVYKNLRLMYKFRNEDELSEYYSELYQNTI